MFLYKVSQEVTGKFAYSKIMPYACRGISKYLLALRASGRMISEAGGGLAPGRDICDAKALLQVPGLSGKRCEDKEGTLPVSQVPSLLPLSLAHPSSASVVCLDGFYVRGQWLPQWGNTLPLTLTGTIGSKPAV